MPDRGLRTAIAFLTRVPVGGGTADVGRAVAWFPIAGALIGAAVGGAYAGLTELVPATVAAAVAVVVGLLITGAFHEDGLADVADAFGGGWTVEDRLRIMKDSRHGTYGVASMCGSIVVRVAALASLGPAAGFAGMVAAHTLARASAVATMVLAPQARSDGLGAAVADATPPRGPAARRLAGIGAGVAVAALAVGWWAAVVAAMAVLGAAAVVWLALRKIGGVTGDVLGAVEQVVECVALVTITALAARHTLWWR